MEYNLITGTAGEFAEAMKAATLLGVEDEQKSASERSGKELAKLLCGSWMKGHHRPLRIAYTAGRWHQRALVEAARLEVA